jgi:hypothetical protein
MVVGGVMGRALRFRDEGLDSGGVECLISLVTASNS